MAIEQTRAQIVSSIWQAVAQSGVDLSAVPQAQQEKLVGQIADNLMLTMNSILDEVPKPPALLDTKTLANETELWQGHPFLSLVESYVITSERVKVVHGLLSRDIENFELIRIKDIDVSQGMGERLMKIGDITIRGADASEPVLVMRNVPKPEQVYETLRKAWLEARKRYGLQFRDYL